MGSSALLMGIIPLFIFVIIDSYAGMKSALISASLLALVEAGMSLHFFGTIDIVTGFSIALVLLLAAISYYAQSPLYFKFQPVVLSGILGAALIILYALGKPLLLIMAMKYKDQLPVEFQEKFGHPMMQELFDLGSLYAGFALIAHAGAVAYAAIKLSNWWWLVIRIAAFYIFLFIAIMIANIEIVSRFQ